MQILREVWPEKAPSNFAKEDSDYFYRFDSVVKPFFRGFSPPGAIIFDIFNSSRTASAREIVATVQVMYNTEDGIYQALDIVLPLKSCDQV